MSYKLIKPFTNEEKTDFIFKYNQDCFNEGYNCRIEETETALYALEDNEILQNDEVIIDPNYEQEQAQKRQTNFETEFFNTSLGWIRRQVNMKDGSTKDFLSDLLPAISMALNSGIATPIITYKTPDFTHDITDWTIYQEIKQVTPQFIQECFDQLSADFGAV